MIRSRRCATAAGSSNGSRSTATSKAPPATPSRSTSPPATTSSSKSTSKGPSPSASSSPTPSSSSSKRPPRHPTPTPPRPGRVRRPPLAGAPPRPDRRRRAPRRPLRRRRRQRRRRPGRRHDHRAPRGPPPTLSVEPGPGSPRRLDYHGVLPPSPRRALLEESISMPERRASLMEPRMEHLLDQVGSKFTLVTLAAKRAREINDYYNQLGEGLGKIVPPQVTSVSRKPLTISIGDRGRQDRSGSAPPDGPEGEAASAEADAAGHRPASSRRTRRIAMTPTPEPRAALRGRVVVLGVTGGIAAYKAVDVCRQLVDAGAHVAPVLTAGAPLRRGPSRSRRWRPARSAPQLFDGPEPIPHAARAAAPISSSSRPPPRPSSRSTPPASPTICSPRPCSPPARRC